MVITIRHFRNFGDVECEDIQPRILYSDIYTVYADQGRDNELFLIQAHLLFWQSPCYM